jgi:hypothetical protein
LGGAATIVVALFLAGCGSDAQYLANEDHEIFVKLTDEWTVLVVEAADESAADPEADPDALPWQRVFDRSSEPQLGHFTAAVPTEPVGLIAAVEPSAGARDSLSLSDLRSFAVGGDPLELAEQGTMSLQMLGNVQDYDVNGNHGNRVRFSFVPQEGGPEVVVDQVAVTDPGRTRIYVIQVKCEAECFREHLGEIDEIISSFHIGDQ